jgi:hypothetical protein
MKKLFRSLILAVAVLPLSAQQTEAGIQGSLLFPQSDLRSAVNGRVGFDVGVHGAIDLGGGSEVRPRIDYTRYDGGSFSVTALSGSTLVEAIGIGADYLSYFEGRNRGLYAVGGIALNWWNAQYRYQGSQRDTSPSVMVGVGHRFNSAVAMEFNVDYGHSVVGTATSIKGGVFYRF